MSRTTRLVLASASALVLLLAGTAWLALRPAAFHGTTYEPVAPAPDFALVDQDGRAATRATFAGAPTLLFFGYTRCPDLCPLTLSRLRRVTRDLPAVRIVLVTVDPAHDTPPVMKRYVARFGPSVTGLTGDSASVARAMAAYGAYVMPPAGHGHAGMALSHGAVVYGLDRAGNLQVVMTEGAREAPLRDDVRTLARL